MIFIRKGTLPEYGNFPVIFEPVLEPGGENRDPSLIENQRAHSTISRKGSNTAKAAWSKVLEENSSARKEQICF